MNISLPESMKAFIDARVATGGYGSHSEYLRELVRNDEIEAARSAMRALIMTGLNSPVGRPWSELKADLLQRASSQP